MHIKEQEIRKIFFISIVLKGVGAAMDLIASLFLLATGTLTWLVSLTLPSAQDLSSHSQLFISFYLFLHFVVKSILVVGLLRNKMWAYPFAIVVQWIFILYQGWHFLFNHSILLFIFTLFDVFVLVLTQHEYKVVKAKMREAQKTN